MRRTGERRAEERTNSDEENGGDELDNDNDDVDQAIGGVKVQVLVHADSSNGGKSDADSGHDIAKATDVDNVVEQVDVEDRNVSELKTRLQAVFRKSPTRPALPMFLRSQNTKTK